jgi:hypothetical protein
LERYLEVVSSYQRRLRSAVRYSGDRYFFGSNVSDAEFMQ